ncbi:MAG TPA: hypothetical protein PLR18_03275 [bacterium]|nr:hypothetical protein [bacterium]
MMGKQANSLACARDSKAGVMCDEPRGEEHHEAGSRPRRPEGRREL